MYTYLPTYLSIYLPTYLAIYLSIYAIYPSIDSSIFSYLSMALRQQPDLLIGPGLGDMRRKHGRRYTSCLARDLR